MEMDFESLCGSWTYFYMPHIFSDNLSGCQIIVFQKYFLIFKILIEQKICLLHFKMFLLKDIHRHTIISHFTVASIALGMKYALHRIKIDRQCALNLRHWTLLRIHSTESSATIRSKRKCRRHVRDALHMTFPHEENMKVYRWKLFI